MPPDRTHGAPVTSNGTDPGTRPSRSDGPTVPDGSLLGLAGALATVGSLTHQVDTTLPVLARSCAATVAVFAVAGSRAAGVRCWPHDPTWAVALRQTFASSWEAGPLTLWFRRAGVVPALRVHDVLPGWGTAPGLVLEHRGLVLAQLLLVPVACTGTIVAGYFLLRSERRFDDDELAAARAAQSVLVASHGRFLRPPEPALTTRQHAVLRLLAEGRTVRAIGSRLGISESTVDKHVRDLYRRLGTQDRASTVRTAELRGLLDGLVGEEWQDLLIVEEA